MINCNDYEPSFYQFFKTEKKNEKGLLFDAQLGYVYIAFTLPGRLDQNDFLVTVREMV